MENCDIAGATVDTTLTNSGRSSLFSLQKIGKVTATLGEIKSRSDLVVFWFCDPEITHPRLLERINSKAPDKSQRIIVVDDRDTATTKLANRFFKVPRENAAELLVHVRNQVAQQANIQASKSEPDTLSAIENTANELVRELVNAKYGSIFFGQVSEHSRFDVAGDSMARLIRSLNDVTRFVSLKLRSDKNAQSAENVLAWSSGFPFAVNHNLGYPRQNGLEFSAESMLERRQCDAILHASHLSETELVEQLPHSARAHFQVIPRIAFSTQATAANVHFQMGIPGINESGEHCRIDNVSMPLKKIHADDWIPAETILDQIRQELIAHS